VKKTSAISAGIRPVRDLFRVEQKGDNQYWFCKLCPFVYYESYAGPSWPITVGGLLALVKHLRGHGAN